MEYWPAFVVVLSVLGLGADVAARASRPWIALAAYAVAGVAWTVLLGQRGASLSRMVTIYGIVSYVLGAIAGLWFFGERLTLVNWMGIGLGLLALVFISHHGE